MNQGETKDIAKMIIKNSLVTTIITFVKSKRNENNNKNKMSAIVDW